jgi:hypothetical protein
LGIGKKLLAVSYWLLACLSKKQMCRLAVLTACPRVKFTSGTKECDWQEALAIGCLICCWLISGWWLDHAFSYWLLAVGFIFMVVISTEWNGGCQGDWFFDG